MKILHVLDHAVPIPTGYSFRTLAILKHQAELGWQTCQLTGIRQDEAQDDREIVESLRFYRTPSAPFQNIPLLRYFVMVVSMKKEIQKAIIHEKPDVIHAHSPALNALAALWAVRSSGGLPVIYEVRAFWEDAAVDHGTVRERGLRYRLTRALETWVIRRVDAVTTICEGLRSDIVSRGVLNSHISVVPNAVNPDRFEFMKPRNEGVRAKYNLGTAPVLGFIGSFYSYEGLDMLVRAMPFVLDKRADARLLLVGGEEQEDGLRKLVSELGLESVVTFAGRVPHEDVAEYYSAIDILVYPRKSMRLTELVTPLKPLEAMALGKPLVLSDVGGHREIAAPLFEEASFVAGDLHSLETRLVKRIESLNDCTDSLKRGRKYVEDERSWKVVIRRYAPVYEKVLSNRANR